MPSRSPRSSSPRSRPAAPSRASRSNRPAAAAKGPARRPAPAKAPKPSRPARTPAPQPAPPAPIAERLARVRTELRTRKLDGYLVQSPLEQRWLTGFTGEDGAVLLTADRTLLLTDGRFDQTADREAPWATKVLRASRGPETTAEWFGKLRLKRVGFDPAHVTVSTFAGLSKAARGTKLESATGIIAALRECKDTGEIANILAAVRVAQGAFERVLKLIKIGMREREIAAYLDFVMRDLGADGAAFEPIVAVGANAALPHHRPGDQRVESGQVLLMDFGARVRGYVSDLTRIVWIGNPPDVLERAYRCVRAAREKAVEAVRPGASAGALDRLARDVIRRAGFEKQFNHSLGHGIGLAVHEAPSLRKTSTEKLGPGMIVTIEPGVYLPGIGGIRLEDDVLVTERGHEVLSSLPLEFRIQ
ncbi:MAG: aminopeptidase P family protein [Phycisphaerales bacterium]|nr:aminopeptidase P family protein [Phycisphaerales bacterium]